VSDTAIPWGGLDADGARRFHKLRRLTDLSRALTYALSLGDVLAIAVDRAVDLLDAERSALLLTEDDGQLVVRASNGIDAEAARLFRAPPTETLTDRLHGLLGATADTFLGVPLVAAGKVTGVLAVGGRKPTLATDEAEWLLSALADQAAVALEKARQEDVATYRERIFGIVGHDLRNPLSAIRMGAQLLLRRGPVEGQQADALRRIVASTETMEEILNALLDLTRAKLGGGIRLERRPVDLHEICRATLTETRLTYPAARISFTPEGDGRGFWDPGRLGQVLSNLLRNAIQYGASAPVELWTRDEKSDKVIEISNQGAPIPEELLPHVFTAFRKGAPVAGGSSGLGLGLYITKEIVSAHGGSIGVRSSAGEGTTFTVRLPRGATAAARGPAHSM
jgi:signal transduction histidine kinase